MQACNPDGMDPLKLPLTHQGFLVPPFQTHHLPGVQAFTEVLSNNETWEADMTETYKLLDVDPASVQGLEDYLKVSHLCQDEYL